MKADDYLKMFRHIFCFFIARLARRPPLRSFSSPLLWPHRMAFCFSILLLCFVRCQCSDSTPGSETDQSRCASREVPSDPHYLELCAFVYSAVCVCVNVNRVFPHLESELCFSSGPFPCSGNSLPPSLFLSLRRPSSSSSSRRFLYKRDRKLAFSVAAHVSWLPRLSLCDRVFFSRV